MLDVTLYGYDPADDEGPFIETDPISVNFVSLYNGGTHGPPALVAPGRASGEAVSPVARPGNSVLYINTAVVPAFRIERDGE